ncbi:TPA: excinuclease ABC subunit A [Candidatus Gastranaerophilales bacterium HUM_19]|nr:MAG TPA: excinuclease ABC subunit A [Candidatus Gastranaerophilales bacterium HUM_16]DAB17064.1 MAG TPA: excinuclease ABC subunit A [Candidatus Gastranaerophilales bacterium HUM_19]DAB25565.1 MAG TPA: excinuclease ABC subunit A [Candidatus Gastranaerophilales bacterium HUM_23]
MTDKIVIKGAREHNLKNVSLEIPKNELVVFTGVSGSGKSSLAFDTIFAEGQRRYIESLSTYARQFLGQMDKPDVDYIDGLTPAISIDQKSTSNNPRSTVGTVTEIYDYLRLLYARIGTPYCPKCGKPIRPQTIDEIVDSILKLETGTKIQILAPIVKGKKGEFQSLFEELRQEGFVRIKADGEVYNLDEDEIKLAKTKAHTISVVVDRVVVKPEARSRIADSVQIALQKADGLCLIDVIGAEELIYSEKLACPDCNLSFEELTPRIFSFNAPYGACDKCGGIGVDFKIDPDLVIPDRNKSIKEGAIYPWSKSSTGYYDDVLKAVQEAYKMDFDIPFKELPQEHQDIILYGSDERIPMRIREFGSKRYRTSLQKFIGVIPFLMKHYNVDSEYWKAEIEKYMVTTPCEKCGGARLKPFPLAVRINGKNIHEFCLMPVDKAYEFVTDLYLTLSDFQMKIGKQILDEVRARLKFLCDVGLNYLNLARTSGTLSGGEAQRIRLATQIGSGLSGVLYVLDEPSIGLHQRDNDRLIKTLLKLRNMGNSLIVVEHDEDTIRNADYIVDIGPKAGVNGGNIIAQGCVEDIIKASDSITGQYLSGERNIPVPKKTREGNGNYLQVRNAHLNNLKNIDIDIPLGKIVVLTGVSGSGKSTLMQDLIYEYAVHKLRKNRPKPQGVDEILGFENLDKIIDIDQSPIGRTPRSNPATYTDVFTPIRELYAKTNEAKMRGYKPGRFSFNVKGGRCEACSGDGVLKIEMNFLSDVYVKCDVCKGKRYNNETLEVKYKGKTIADVLEMSVKEAYEFFENIPQIANKLKTLVDVGLDYIKLGQSATTLSGGEAQRIKLASELNKRATGKTLYLLDEPSVGLHWYDLDKLIKIIQQLADNGNTILIIEHNLDLIKIADYIIDLGPEGGDMGGNIVACGTPREVAKNPSSYTGQYLKQFFQK